MSQKQVVLAIFDNEAEADEAAEQVKTWEQASKEVKPHSIGVLVMDEKGKTKTHKLGARSTGKGAGIGLILAMLTPVGMGVSVIGGAVLGRLHRKGLGLSEEDRDRISAELKEGRAVVGVLAPASESAAIKDKLAELGGRSESHETSDEVLEEAAKEAPPAASTA